MQGTLVHISAQYIMLEISQLWSSQNWSLQKSRVPIVKSQTVDRPIIQFWTLWQYISIQIPIYKQSENLWVCY